MKAVASQKTKFIAKQSNTNLVLIAEHVAGFEAAMKLLEELNQNQLIIKN